MAERRCCPAAVVTSRATAPGTYVARATATLAADRTDGADPRRARPRRGALYRARIFDPLCSLSCDASAGHSQPGAGARLRRHVRHDDQLLLAALGGTALRDVDRRRRHRRWPGHRRPDVCDGRRRAGHTVARRTARLPGHPRLWPVLLGAPALAMSASTSLLAILLLCVVRGLGFAVLVVIGSALVGSLVPSERRGEGLGIFGVVVGVPSVVALPLGVWLVGRVGYPPVFVAGALAALVSLIAVPGLPVAPSYARDQSASWPHCACQGCCAPRSCSPRARWRAASWSRSCRWRSTDRRLGWPSSPCYCNRWR